MKFMKNTAQWELNTWGDNWWNMRREFSGSLKCVTGMCTGRGGDFCGYNDRTSGRWRTALLPTEDGIGIIHKMKLAQGPYFEVAGQWKPTVLKRTSVMFYAAACHNCLFWPAAIAHWICCEIISRCEVIDLSHSTSYSSIVARSWRMNMYSIVIDEDWYPFSQIFVKWCIFGYLLWRVSRQIGVPSASTSSLLTGRLRRKLLNFKYVICAVSFNFKIICTVCCWQRTMRRRSTPQWTNGIFWFGSSPHFWRFGGWGGDCWVILTHTPNTEAHSTDGWNGSSESEFRERSGASSSRRPKVASSATCFLHWVAEVKDLVYRLPLRWRRRLQSR